MKRRRRRGASVDPITAAYDAILATEPTVPLLFRLTEYRGQQVLFQDAACTVPVASIGDPVGGVRHPVTGAILATQATDAARPIWGGEDVGLTLEGTEFLTVQSNVDFITETGVFSMLSSHQLSSEAAGRICGIFSGDLSTAAGSAGLVFEDRSDVGSMESRNFWTRAGGAPREIRTSDVYVLGQKATASLTGDGFAGLLRSYLGGVEIGTRVFTDGSGSSFTSTLSVGAAGDPSPASYYLGSIATALAYDKTLSPSEVSNISALLEAV